MVKIKLVRHGAKRSPFYKVVATDSRYAGDGKALERLGFFNPMARGQEVKLNLNVERINHWVGQGAQLSTRVGTLLKQAQKTA
ncbi:30S ribosomal protein S16 [Marinicella sp. S1101]|uniref:30S ribosomal protein S16 n=1 Tax=Marinicella marina TaxID=2996016 RepID=UPI002260C18D|nr:30S ribosomal protein S16 [Marinicella marina]MCX7554799.1 30S ribosomal protein S16 [Marinicella marina]MDJ1140968.1 30S ribosomal protein S16 [Marinicella marina]